jgi:small nuclear ribonucleoprotein (snRNP)-like protein
VRKKHLAVGVLKGYDALLNLVLDSAVGMHSFMRPFIDKKTKIEAAKA